MGFMGPHGWPTGRYRPFHARNYSVEDPCLTPRRTAGVNRRSIDPRQNFNDFNDKFIEGDERSIRGF